VPWTPKLQRFRDCIELWTMVLKSRKGIKVSSRRIRRFHRKTRVELHSSLTIAEVETRLKQAHSDYKQAKQHAEVWRMDFMEDLATQRAQRKDTTVDFERTQLLRVERQKQSARRIKHMRGLGEQLATTQVYVTEHGVRRAVTTKSEIEQVCMAENESRFSQCEDTPPMTVLAPFWGWLYDDVHGEEIRKGSFEPPPELDAWGRKVLPQLAQPGKVADTAVDEWGVSWDDHQAGWRRQSEFTSSEPSTMSFSHYKASCHDPIIGQFDAMIRDLPMRYGFAPELWQRLVDVEILKKAGVYDIEKMRTITLMNSAFNANNKLIGKRMMEAAEKAGALAPEQYGSRKQMNSIAAALNKRLTFDLARQTHTPTVLCSNDAKSCYDRVVHNFAILAMQRLGVPPRVSTAMFQTLQTAVHKIRTAYGISTSGYGGKRQPPLQGLGQGNGCGPACWAAISTVLLDTLRESGFGFQLVTALSAILIEFVGYAFVDDTDIVLALRNLPPTLPGA